MLDYRPFQHSQEMDRRFLLPGGDAPRVLEPVATPFDPICAGDKSARRTVGVGRPTLVGPAFFGDDHADAAAPQSTLHPRNNLVLCHHLAFRYPGCRHAPGRRGRVAHGDLKADASGSVADPGLFRQPKIYRLTKPFGGLQQAVDQPACRH